MRSALECGNSLILAKEVDDESTNYVDADSTLRSTAGI
jgi:hypothetical protein